MASQDQIKGGILLVIGFMLVTLLGAELLPQAFDTWFNTTTTSWDGATASIWDIVPLFVVLGMVLYFVGQAFDVF